MDDIELLRSYAEDRSEAAFTELVRRHLNLVYSGALRQVGGDSHRAEEVAQIVFTDLARKARSVAKHPALAGWLYTSTHYAASKLMRAERRRHHYEQEAMAAAVEMSEPDWQQVRPILDEAMHDLSRSERDALVLRYLEQRPMTEVGGILGLSESGARKNVERGLERLRLQLARRGVTSAPIALSMALSSRTVLAAPPGLAASIGSSAIAEAGMGGPLLFTLMSTTKFQVGIAALLVAFVGSLLLFQRGQLTRARSAEAAIHNELNRIKAETVAASHRADAARTALDAEAGFQLPGGGAITSLASLSNISATTQRLNLDTDYAGLFRRLNLDSVKVERLKDLLAERSVRSWNVRRYVGEVTGRGMDEWANKTEELEYIAAGSRDIDARIGELLGTDGLALYRDYERTLPWRAPFKALAATLASLAPLTEQQLDQLTIWAADASPNLFTDVGRGGPKVPDQVLTQARSILTPAQLDELAKLKASEDGYQQMMRVNRRVKEREANLVAPNI